MPEEHACIPEKRPFLVSMRTNPVGGPDNAQISKLRPRRMRASAPSAELELGEQSGHIAATQAGAGTDQAQISPTSTSTRTDIACAEERAEQEDRKRVLVEPPLNAVNIRAHEHEHGREFEAKHRPASSVTVVQRYVWRLRFKSGDRVIVCVRECGRSTWRHGFVANMKNMPPISTGGGQYAYPVVYQKSPRAVGYFKVSRGEIFYDAVLSSGMDIDPYGLD
ncbi:hypothetical protein L226DRAFT_219877 [Lentinus tigrinus ALCF2SS1-7]|uniref:uncharacterized protein n=1 Tax=Lentinus tigrinus ALCF2SS1-7 TaxID=1328758 RepID=UPI00116625C7|nr:hypothetical protein L226DRAFT_219877 [Lentinus tigrinus ALCF2SS1-7]